jgi:signal transduction histidine kinase
MEGGGRLIVSTRAATGAGQPDYIEIEVRDTGRGIQPEYITRIFDPFFTLKTNGGAGLGLSVAYRIIKNHGGEIQVESAPNDGTVFTIRLPATAPGDKS